jgi:hypothetical protein
MRAKVATAAAHTVPMTTMDTAKPQSSEQADSSRMARFLAPEDVRKDQYVCVMRVLREHTPYWCLFEESTWRKPEPIQLSWLAEDGSAPLRVIEVCLPFVLVEQVDRTQRMLDLRRHCLGRVSDRFGSRAFKRLRRPRRKNASDSYRPG